MGGQKEELFAVESFIFYILLKHGVFCIHKIKMFIFFFQFRKLKRIYIVINVSTLVTLYELQNTLARNCMIEIALKLRRFRLTLKLFQPSPTIPSCTSPWRMIFFEIFSFLVFEFFSYGLLISVNELSDHSSAHRIGHDCWPKGIVPWLAPWLSEDTIYFCDLKRKLKFKRAW